MAPTQEVSLSYETYGIRDVWADNMLREFQEIRKVVQTHKFVAMDTEFPGVVARPIGEFRNTEEYNYQRVRVNVNMLKIIQLGISFFNHRGQKATPVSTWQFNFTYNETEDWGAADSMELLRKSGIDFERHAREGINPNHFAAELLSSGVVLMDDVHWLTFHSGYDFGYLVRILMGADLGQQEEEFFSLLKVFFANIYDLKHMMKSVNILKGGLQDLANMLQVKRLGPQHQAGSDSLLTGDAFFKMREEYFGNNLDRWQFCGKLFSLNTTLFNEDDSPPDYWRRFGSETVKSGEESANQTNGAAEPKSAVTLSNRAVTPTGSVTVQSDRSHT